MRRIVVNYSVVYGPPTAVILIGYAMGRNVWFSAHGGLGWLILYLCVPFSLGAQLIRIARSTTKIAGFVDACISLVLFVVVFVALFELMPNYWPGWE